MEYFKQLTVDKLELCYRCSVPLHEAMQGGEIIDTEHFHLEPVKSSLAQVNYKVDIKNNIPDLSWRRLGTFKIIIEREYPETNFRYCWISIINRMLYTYQNQENMIFLINLFKNELHLTLNNITNYELAYDTNFDSEQVINTWLEDYSKDAISLSRAYQEGDYFPVCTRESWGTRSQKLLEHMRIKGSDTKFQLYIYNKKQEMVMHSKDYIERYYDEQYGDTLWRFELRCYKPQFQDFQQMYSVTAQDVLDSYLFCSQGQEVLMDYLSGRLLKFRRNRYDIKSAFQVLKEY